MEKLSADSYVTVKELYQSLGKSMEALIISKQRVCKSRNLVERGSKKGVPYYGINTGFGALATKRVSDGQLAQLQRNLILSDIGGVGNAVSKEVSKLILQLKVHKLGIGYSGVSPKTFERLLIFLREELIQIIPEKGSVGTSGGLAPLAHMSLAILGYGEFRNGNRAYQIQ
jgi:histidine ammonia-lyase